MSPGDAKLKRWVIYGFLVLILISSYQLFRYIPKLSISPFSQETLDSTSEKYLPVPGANRLSPSTSQPLQDLQSGSLLSICSDGISICENGKAIILRGADAPHLIWGESPGSWQWAGLDRLEKDIHTLRSWGANFVVISFDPGRVDDPSYAGQIVEAVTYAHNLGFHVELMQHHSQWDLQNDQPVFVPLPITDDPSGSLVTDVDQRWMQLLAHSGVAASLSKTVDIFGIYSEPDQRVNRLAFFDATTDISWNQWRSRAEKACLDIRAEIQRQAVCSISGIHWASDVTGYLSDPFQIPGVALEVHQYQHFETGSEVTYLSILGFPLLGSESGINRADNWERLAGKVPLIVGEFGNDDPPDYVQGLLTDMEKYRVSWAAWSLIGWAPDEGMIDCQTGALLPLGEMVQSTLLSSSSKRIENRE